MVETRALRRSDEIKTAVLRAVSHDLRSPVTAIVTSAEALASPALEEGEREELAAGITAESTRLARLIDKLLELSRLEAGASPPRRDWCALEELLREAVTSAGVAPERVKLVRRPRPAADPRGRRAARARVREPDRERRAPLATGSRSRSARG